MPTDFEIALENQPGELAKVGKAFGDAGLNILGFCATTTGSQGKVHFLVDDPAAAQDALGSIGITEYGEREMVILEAEDAPGALGKIAAQVSERGGNIELGYTIVGGTRLAIGADELDTVTARF